MRRGYGGKFTGIRLVRAAVESDVVAHPVFICNQAVDSVFPVLDSRCLILLLSSTPFERSMAPMSPRACLCIHSRDQPDTGIAVVRSAAGTCPLSESVPLPPAGRDSSSDVTDGTSRQAAACCIPGPPSITALQSVGIRLPTSSR